MKRILFLSNIEIELKNPYFRLGAYKKGSNREVDEAIFYYPKIEEFLSQGKQEKFSLAECYEMLGKILATPYVPEN